MKYCFFLIFQGKTFPKIKKKSHSTGQNLLAMLTYNDVENNGNDEEMMDESSMSSDYVFRILTSMGSEFCHDQNPGMEYF